MKKMFFVSAIMLMGVGAAFMSCNSDSVDNGCKCEFSEGRASYTYEYTAKEVKNAGYKSCKALAKDIEEEMEYDVKVTCKGR